MAYFEVYNKVEAKEVARQIYDTKPPYRIQMKKIYPKAEIDANKYFNGPIVRTFMKHTGYTHSDAKAWLAIQHACIAEIELGDKPNIEEMFESYNIYLYQKGALIYLNERYYSNMHKDYHGTMYVTQKTSQMDVRRRNRFVDEILSWMKDQGIELAKNPDYKDELEF